MQSSICFYTTKIILIARAHTTLSNCVIVPTGVCVCECMHICIRLGVYVTVYTSGLLLISGCFLTTFDLIGFPRVSHEYVKGH